MSKRPPDNPRSLYVSFDVYEDSSGVHTVDYAQWETSGAVRVWPVETWTDRDGETHIKPARGHGGPVLSLMTRRDVERPKLHNILASLLTHF